MSEVATKIIDRFTKCKLKLSSKVTKLLLETRELSYIESKEPEESFGGAFLSAPIQRIKGYADKIITKEYIVLN